MTRRVRVRDDDGSILLLTAGLVVVAAMLVAVVAGVSQVFLAKRSLVAATDAAALAAAQAVDLDAVYSGEVSGAGLPVDPGAADEAVRAYVALADLDGRTPGFAVEAVRVDGDTVTVRTRAEVPLVLIGPVTGGRAVVEVAAESSARSQVR